MRKKMNIAIVGATGLVGKKILQVLTERKIDANLHLFALESGQKMQVEENEYEILDLNEESFEKLNLDYAFFAVEAEISKEYAPKFAKNGTIVIDNSNAFRREKDVPLVVPQVNPQVLDFSKKIIANPNCSTIQLVTALKPLSDKFGLKRVIVSTYQAVSGAGQNAIFDLLHGTQNKFDFPIQNNLIPQIDVFLPNGYTKEEDKLIFESRKILGLPRLHITATAVRVPIQNCHSESVNVEFEKNPTIEEVFDALKNAKNIVLQDDVSNQIYPMPLFANEKDEVFVGRIRKDESHKNCFNLWVVADNLRRGAASNAVDIFETLQKMKKEGENDERKDF